MYVASVRKTREHTKNAEFRVEIAAMRTITSIAPAAQDWCMVRNARVNGENPGRAP